MWPSPHKPPTCRILSKLRLIHHQRTHLLLITMVLLFSHFRLSCAKLWAFECEQYATWFRSHAVLIMRVNPERVGLPVWYADEQKCAYKNLTLQSGSPTRSVVTSVRSSARDRSSRIDYWTLNSRNVNSMFAASGWFMRRRSHLSDKFDSQSDQP